VPVLLMWREGAGWLDTSARLLTGRATGAARCSSSARSVAGEACPAAPGLTPVCATGIPTGGMCGRMFSTRTGLSSHVRRTRAGDHAELDIPYQS
jgi:hypothetical protein